MYEIIQTTTNDENVVKSICREILNKKLSLCIQTNKIESNYIWEDKECKENEFLIIVKAKVENKMDIIKIIKRLSNYNVPEIISFAFKIETDEYDKWFNQYK